MNTSRGKYVGVAVILLLLASGYSHAEVSKNSVLEVQSSTLAVETAGEYAGLNIIDIEEMSSMRGGFSIAGLDMTFGATLRTLIDNIKLETVFNITAAGAEIVSQVLSDVGGLNDAMAAVSQQVAAIETSVAADDSAVASVTQVTLQQAAVPPSTVNNSVVAGSNTNTPASTNVSPANAGSTTVLVGPQNGVSVTDVTPVGISLDGLSSDNNFSGVVVSNSKGFTAALHRLTQNAAINAIVSNASNLRVSQKLDIKIEIANTRAARSAAKAAALSQWANSLRR